MDLAPELNSALDDEVISFVSNMTSLKHNIDFSFKYGNGYFAALGFEASNVDLLKVTFILEENNVMVPITKTVSRWLTNGPNVRLGQNFLQVHCILKSFGAFCTKRCILSVDCA